MPVSNNWSVNIPMAQNKKSQNAFPKACPLFSTPISLCILAMAVLVLFYSMVLPVKAADYSIPAPMESSYLQAPWIDKLIPELNKHAKPQNYPEALKNILLLAECPGNEPDLACLLTKNRAYFSIDDNYQYFYVHEKAIGAGLYVFFYYLAGFKPKLWLTSYFQIVSATAASGIAYLIRQFPLFPPVSLNFRTEEQWPYFSAPALSAYSHIELLEQAERKQHQWLLLAAIGLASKIKGKKQPSFSITVNSPAIDLTQFDNKASSNNPNVLKHKSLEKISCLQIEATFPTEVTEYIEICRNGRQAIVKLLSPGLPVLLSVPQFNLAPIIKVLSMAGVRRIKYLSIKL